MVVSLLRFLGATNVLSMINVMFNWPRDVKYHIYKLDAMMILKLFIYLLKYHLLIKDQYQIVWVNSSYIHA